MDVAFVVDAFENSESVKHCPWVYCARELASHEIHICPFDSIKKAWRAFDAMLLMTRLDWTNPAKFKAEKALPIMEHYAEYRAVFPDTVQIVLNHSDVSERPYAVPYWRRGDPILYRTPPYDRSLAKPFPADDIWGYEHVYGTDCFRSSEIRYAAGFIGSPSGPSGYRNAVAEETAKVGYGLCTRQLLPRPQYNTILAACRIIVCPQGWGGNSIRHWDAWKSGKPVLTDKRCAAVEMIPGVRLQHGTHYLVYDDPRDIPDLVSDWTRPGRADDLAFIAQNGSCAAKSYDAYAYIRAFFETRVRGLHR